MTINHANVDTLRGVHHDRGCYQSDKHKRELVKLDAKAATMNPADLLNLPCQLVRLRHGARPLSASVRSIAAIALLGRVVQHMVAALPVNQWISILKSPPSLHESRKFTPGTAKSTDC